MRIAIDIDSTLHHYWDGFADAAQRRFGVVLPYEEQVTWEIDQLRPEQVRTLIAETHSEPVILAAEPYPGAVQAIGRWHEAGHFIHVTSHRSDSARDATLRWLSRIGLAYDELHCSFDKVGRCREIGIDVLIDDSPLNLARALQVGIVPATIAHPWNRDLCREEGLIRASDWPALARSLEPVLAAAVA